MHEHHRIKPKTSQIQKDTITDDYCMRRLFASAFGSSSSSSTTRTSGGNPRNMLKRPAQVPSDGDNSNACKMRKIVHTNVSWPDGHLPDGPIGIERQFEFGQVFLERMEAFLGKTELCSRLCAWDWHVNTTFTGVSCAEIAATAMSEHARAYVARHGDPTQKAMMVRRSPVTFGYMCDFDVGAQKALLRLWGNTRCLFSDVTKWLGRDNDFNKYAQCVTHKKACPLPVTKADKNEVEISGPSCVMFSRSGKRLRQLDQRFQVHNIWLMHRARRQEPLKIFENTAGYDASILDSSFSDHDTRSVIFDPRHLGYGAARTRFYAVLVHKSRARWTTQLSLGDLLQALMAKPVMLAPDFFYLKVKSPTLASAKAKESLNDNPILCTNPNVFQQQKHEHKSHNPDYSM